MPPNIALISGELSGDLVGGALARCILAHRPDVKLWGVGSVRMLEAGVELIQDSSEWSAIGAVQILRIFPKLRFRMYPFVLKELARRKPCAVVLIDFGMFNIKVLRWCHARGIPAVYYFPPGSWRRQGRSGEELAQLASIIATPFPWSATRFAELGARVEFVGHPLLELVKPRLSRAQFAERLGLEPGHPIIGLLPGSRGFEVEHNTPAMLGAAKIIAQRLPHAQFVFGAASTMARARIERSIREAGDFDPSDPSHPRALGEITQAIAGIEERISGRTEPKLVTPEGIQVPASVVRKQEAARQRAEAAREQGLPPTVIADDLTYDVMAHSDALLICSGTATLEAAILGTPMVILYRGTRLMKLEYNLRRLKNIRFMGLPNIVADQLIVPELRQDEANPQALADHVLTLLLDPAARGAMRDALDRVRGELGQPGASERVAQLTLAASGLDK